MDTTLSDSEIAQACKCLEESGFSFWAKKGYEQLPILFTPDKRRMPGELDIQVACIVRARAKRVAMGKWTKLTFLEG